jgi:hypothetical protein
MNKLCPFWARCLRGDIKIKIQKGQGAMFCLMMPLKPESGQGDINYADSGILNAYSFVSFDNECGIFVLEFKNTQ